MSKPRPLTTKEEQEVLNLLREIAQQWKYEILDDEPIDGADFIDSLQPVLQLLKKELVE
jgi:hypothetical protein